jgi:hypothetical protein
VLVVYLIGRPGDAATAAITTAVVLVASAVSPQHPWQPPILRLADTVIGVAIGVAAAWLGLCVTGQQAGAEPVTGTTRPLDGVAGGFGGVGAPGWGGPSEGAVGELVDCPFRVLLEAVVVDRIIRRHPELFLANDDARNYNPAVSAFEQAPEVLLKPPPFEVHEVGARDDGDPTDADGGRTAAIIARLQRKHRVSSDARSRTR